MNITLMSGSPETVRTGMLVVGVFTDAPLPPAATRLDAALGGRLSSLVELGEIGKDPGASVVLHGPPGLAADRLLVVSLGKGQEVSDKAFREALAGAARVLAGGAATTACIVMADLAPEGRSAEWRLRHASRILADGAYRFDAPGKRRDAPRPPGAGEISLLLDGVTDETPISEGLAIAEGMALAKDLGNLPGNVCNPAYLAETGQALGKEFGFEVDVLERADLEQLGMGSLLSVGRASLSPCKFIVMHYRGGAVTGKPVVLVGKGVTFDTGGISLKPAALLDEMKYDMSGAGSVFGVVKTIARLSLSINVIGIVPAVENMPGGNASRPGDVVTSMSGQTIEILNTDAEGRLVLCDALTYAERFDPDCVVDLATLTGACVVALGGHASGLFTDDDVLAEELLKSSSESGDRAWRMPLWDDYQVQLKSNFADMSNLGGPAAGAVTAACFLARFTSAYRWAHLDIAGTASTSGDAKGSTGRPVPLLSEFLLGRAKAGSTVGA
jgi:leucyl aminopeptidase